MDTEEIKNIDAEVKKLLESIKLYQEEIKTYKTGYEAFEKASKALSLLAEDHQDLAVAIRDSARELGEVDAATLLARLEDESKKITALNEGMGKTLAMLTSSFDVLDKKIESAIDNLNNAATQLGDVAKAAQEHNQTMAEASNRAIMDTLEKLENRVTELVQNTGKELANFSSKNTAGMEHATAVLSVKIDNIDKNVSNVVSQMEEGVKVKKRFF